jgi:hypothetical protein
MDIASIGALLSSLKTASDIAKIVRESTKTLTEAETKLKLAELVSALADMKFEIANVQNELLTRTFRIKELEEELRLKQELQFVDPCYWIANGNASEPYCQPCYDDSKKLSHLVERTKGLFSCAVCAGAFKIPELRSEEEGRRQAAAVKLKNRPRMTF